MTTIRQLHRHWSDKVMPKDASPVQRQEMERAFYSGCLSLLNLQLNEISDLPYDEAESALAHINNELSDYFKLLRTISGTHGTETQ